MMAGKILITGGQMENKGAQAMTFTVINEIKLRYPDKEIVVNCTDEDRNYAFPIIRMGKKLKVALLGGIYSFIGNLMPANAKASMGKKEMDQFLKQTEMIIDISGFALSSQFSIRHSINFIVNIMLAKRYKIPMILFPQSFGPFNYKGIYKYIVPALIRKYITYPKIIYAREEEGMKFLSPYTTSNVRRSIDTVLQGTSAYEISYIFKQGIYEKKKEVSVRGNAVAIIPNVKTMKYGSQETLLEIYREMVNHLLSRNLSVYLLRHSTEDLQICKEIKQSYAFDERVVLLEEEFNCLDIHEVLNQFQFIIGSRYHSIVHAYKNGIPVLALGWATKYKELLQHFDQSSYLFDVRDIEHVQGNMVSAIDLMIRNRDLEAQKISEKLKELNKENIFNEAFGHPASSINQTNPVNSMKYAGTTA